MEHFGGPCLVLAGPGSGKTFTLTRRIEHLIRVCHVPPEQILVITFTKAAATEMQQRFYHLMGEVQPVVFGTFHSVFYRMLREEGFAEADQIITGKDRQQLLKEAASRCHFKSVKQDFFQILSREISYIANTGVDPLNYQSKVLPQENVGRIYEEYQSLKSHYQMMDFDDLLTKTREMFLQHEDILNRWRRRFRFFLLDEVQDMNEPQFQVIRMLAEPKNNIFAVGDDDQSIYRFRGAAPRLMLDFSKYYPGCHVICLQENFRCGGSITAAANRLISHNKIRYEKHMTQVQDRAGVVQITMAETAEDEAKMVTEQIKKLQKEGFFLEDMAMLFRGYAQMRSVMETCVREGIPFYLKDRMPNPYDHWVMSDVITYLKLAENVGRGKPMDREDLIKIMNRPRRFLARGSLTAEKIRPDDWKAAYNGKVWMQERIELLCSQLQRILKMPGYTAVHYLRKTVGYDEFVEEYMQAHPEETECMERLEQLEKLARGTKNIREFMDKIEGLKKETEQANRRAGKKNGIGMYTIHGAKGLEFAVVFLLGCNEGDCPSKNAVTSEDLEEERRIFYVGITRAKERLYL